MSHGGRRYRRIDASFDFGKIGNGNFVPAPTMVSKSAPWVMSMVHYSMGWRAVSETQKGYQISGPFNLGIPRAAQWLGI